MLRKTHCHSKRSFQSSPFQKDVNLGQEDRLHSGFVAFRKGKDAYHSGIHIWQVCSGRRYPGDVAPPVYFVRGFLIEFARGLPPLLYDITAPSSSSRISGRMSMCLLQPLCFMLTARWQAGFVEQLHAMLVCAEQQKGHRLTYLMFNPFCSEVNDVEKGDIQTPQQSILNYTFYLTNWLLCIPFCV